jgi:hypothetical protein
MLLGTVMVVTVLVLLTFVCDAKMPVVKTRATAAMMNFFMILIFFLIFKLFDFFSRIKHLICAGKFFRVS